MRVTRLHAIGPDLTAAEVREAIRCALISKLGFAHVREGLDSGELRIEVEE